MVWNGDNNLFRSTITHNQGTDAVYVEQSKDNPTSTEGARVQAGGNVNLLATPAPVTIKMRYMRTAAANTVVGQYQVIAPANIGERRLGRTSPAPTPRGPARAVAAQPGGRRAA